MLTRREDDEEVARAARAMIANHGVNAAQEAQRRANNLRRCGADGQAHKWQMISLMIRRLSEQDRV